MDQNCRLLQTDMYVNNKDLKFEQNPYMDSGDIGCSLISNSASVYWFDSEMVLSPEWTQQQLPIGVFMYVTDNVSAVTEQILLQF